MKSQNGYPVLTHAETRKWVIPGTGRHFVLAKGAPGFVLAHFALWFHETIEALDVTKIWDEWGYAVREVRDSDDISNHASATAIDINATLYGLGTHPLHHFKPKEIARIRRRLAYMQWVIRWGGFYEGRKDPMHFEINATRARVRVVAAMLAVTPRGRRIRKANPVLR